LRDPIRTGTVVVPVHPKAVPIEVVAGRSASASGGGRSWAYASPAVRHARIARTVDVALLAIAVAALAAAVVGWALHLRFQPVLSGSMRPGIQPGDLAITQPVPATSLRTGDVVSFYPPGRDEPVLHRITAVERVAGGVVLTTAGDANDGADPWGRIVVRGPTAWRLIGTVPKVGYVSGWARSIRGPALILAGSLIAVSGLLIVRRRPGTRRPARAAEGRRFTWVSGSGRSRSPSERSG
jgi:signal peptidase